MTEKPLLLFAAPIRPRQRGRLSGGPSQVHFPTIERQVERLDSNFAELERTLETWKARLQTEATGIVPEDVLILETAGPVEDFLIAARNLGMEWLGEIEDEDIPPDDDFFEVNQRGEPKSDKLLRGRTFLVFTDHTALARFLALWTRWKTGSPLEAAQSKWSTLFELLRDIHRWGIHDRLQETGILEDWHERLSHNQEVVPCEIELWFRQDQRKRNEVQSRVSNLVKLLNGEVLNSAIIEEIDYHALLVNLPIASIEPVLEGSIDAAALIQCEQIQFFRATGQMVGITPEGETTQDLGVSSTTASLVSDEPVVALLDGLPLQNHQRLTGRLIVDDPDGFEEFYQAKERCHSTAMASLIIHGDLNSNGPALIRPLYVRPILRPDERDWRTPKQECAPHNMLIVDLVHRAVRRLFENEGENKAVAPSIRVINLSICIADRVFDGSLSPLSRLLDWLAWKYKILFIVSAGNYMYDIELGTEQPSSIEFQTAVLKTIAADTRNRRLMSPAEAINVVTVAAINYDETNNSVPPNLFNPFIETMLPSPINAQGMGFRRAIKPELLAPGGQLLFFNKVNSPSRKTYSIYRGTQYSGQRVAFPGNAGETNASCHTQGTSNAAALTSRASAELYEVLQDLNSTNNNVLNSVPVAIWLKTLLVHGAEWGSSAAILEHTLKTPQNSRQFKEYVTRLLGYGNINIDPCKECTEYRVTALGGALISADVGHIYQLPLPPSLSGHPGMKKLKISLAWLTPLNPLHQAWRRAQLWFESPKSPLKIDRQEAEWHSTRRGTIQHEILEGNYADAFVDGDHVEIQVNCRAEAGTLTQQIPYALAVTLQVAEEIGVPIYNEIRIRLPAARVIVTPV